MTRIETLREGRGIFDSFTHFFKAREHAPPQVRKFLEQTKGRKIVSMQAGRVPLSTNLQTAFNVFSLGDFEKERNRLGYNDIYHAFLVMTLDDGKQYKIEKNNVVSVKPYHPVAGQQLFQVHLQQDPTTTDLLGNAEKYQEQYDDRPNFWTYDHKNNNCQYFVDDIIKGNHSSIKNGSDVTQFTVQPDAYKTVEKINQTLPFVQKIPNFLAGLDRFYYGNGFRQPKHYRHTTLHQSHMYRYKPY